MATLKQITDKLKVLRDNPPFNVKQKVLPPSREEYNIFINYLNKLYNNDENSTIRLSDIKYRLPKLWQNDKKSSLKNFDEFSEKFFAAFIKAEGLIKEDKKLEEFPSPPPPPTKERLIREGWRNPDKLPTPSSPSSTPTPSTSSSAGLTNSPSSEDTPMQPHPSTTKRILQQALEYGKTINKEKPNQAQQQDVHHKKIQNHTEKVHKRIIDSVYTVIHSKLEANQSLNDDEKAIIPKVMKLIIDPKPENQLSDKEKYLKEKFIQGSLEEVHRLNRINQILDTLGAAPKKMRSLSPDENQKLKLNINKILQDISIKTGDINEDVQRQYQMIRLLKLEIISKAKKLGLLPSSSLQPKQPSAPLSPTSSKSNFTPGGKDSFTDSELTSVDPKRKKRN